MTTEVPNSDADHGQALPAGTRIEEFIVERVLGSGGFGITYLARDTSLGRQVVIKENLPAQFCFRDTHSLTVAPRHTTGGDADDFEWSMKNFLREAETLASLDHPGIVRVLRKFEANGTGYFVMPYVEGIPFDALIEERKTKNQPFTQEELHGLTTRMLDALGYIHDRGIYHRDIKPANLLITSEGIPVLIDFGSARQRLSERSMTVIESAGYTPFEQLQSRGDVGPWSDLYALGATLVKAITGEAMPKAADRMMGDPWKEMSKDSRWTVLFSLPFLQSIDKALVVDPAHRWRSGGEWLQGMTQTPTATKSDEFPSTPPLPTVVLGGNETRPETGGMREDSGSNSVKASTPALWNPSAAVNFGIALLPPLGPYLHAKNAKVLGRPAEEKSNMNWFYGMGGCYFLGMVFNLNLGVVLLYVVWYTYWAKKQMTQVKETYGKKYPRRRFGKPLLIGYGCFAAMLGYSQGLRSIYHDAAGAASESKEVFDSRKDGAIEQYNLGLAYDTGTGVSKDEAVAVKWYRKAAEQGYSVAQYRLGVCYDYGTGVSKDEAEAVKWYRKAAEQGDQRARNALERLGK
jgi:serine/threonine protein kinase